MRGFADFTVWLSRVLAVTSVVVVVGSYFIQGTITFT